MKQLRIILFIVMGLTIGSCSNKKKQDQPQVKEITLRVEEMTCKHCEMAIQRSIATLPGIDSVKASHLDSTTFVRFDAAQTDQKSIISAIEKKGYRVVHP